MCFTRSLVLGSMILPAFILTASCGLKDRFRSFFGEEGKDSIAVRIGSRTYSKADLELYFDSRLNEFRDPANADKIKSNLLESFIEDKLLLDQAEKAKIEPSQDAIKQVMAGLADGGADKGGDARNAELERSVVENLKMQQYLRDFLTKKLSVTDRECEAYYGAHLGEYIENDIVHIREILVSDPAQAQRILAQLKAKRNKNFANMARLYSQGSTATEGGDLGNFQRKELPEEFEKAVFPLSPGSVSKIVRSKYGYHIFFVEAKIKAHKQKYIEVKDHIRDKLLLELERDTIKKELEALKRQISVEINRGQLDFHYVGTQFAVPEGTFP